ncbi:unnamed protein product, partial [Ectocarpus fasciculatus]
TTSKGTSRCIDAILVMLSQGCDRGVGSQYVSTLELQLVSLEFCRVCRSVPTLHARVDEDTPRSLWDPDETLVPRRVPAVLMLGLTWRVRTPDVFTRNSEAEWWEWL